MAMATTYSPLPAAEHSAQLRKAVIASLHLHLAVFAHAGP